MNKLNSEMIAPEALNQAAAVNLELDRRAASGRVDEDWLADETAGLETAGSVCEDVHWLTLARLAELAVFRAGGLIDRGRLREAGDLMFNPRLILVHVKGRSTPVRKERHAAMTEQFRPLAGTADVKTWLKQNTINEIREKPLVPALLETLRAGGRLAVEGLDRLEARTRRAADAVNLVSACLNGPWGDFEEYLRKAGEADRLFVESGLCRFDLDRFWDLGGEIDAAAWRPGYRSPFLRY